MRFLTWLALAFAFCLPAQFGFLYALAEEQAVRECALEDRAVAFLASRPGGRPRAARERERIHDLVVMVLAEVTGDLTGTRDGDAALVLAVAFRESSWQPGEIGRRGEVGYLQLHGIALRGTPPGLALDPARNLRLGVQYMRRCKEVCGPEPERWLSGYGTGVCHTSTPGARRALAWAAQMECGGGA